MEVMARYGYGAEADVAWKVGRIMLRYRPIAPKPLTGGAFTAAPLDVKSSSGRGKRKGCAKEGRRGRKSAKKTLGVFSEEKNTNNNNSNNNTTPVVTLPLMPVTPERREEEDLSSATPSPTGSDGHVAISCFGPPSWKRLGPTTTNNSNSNIITTTNGGIVVAPRPVRPVGSWVTVECVSDTWQEGNIPADTEDDTCPVFFSDALGERVTWTNAAYRRMVVGPIKEDEEEEEEEEEAGDEEVRVALVTRGLVPASTCFTCRVRVRYACRGRGKVSVAAPCDVWTMADGGLAWRLDVKAALSLGLGS